jgi:hypothetical protein
MVSLLSYSVLHLRGSVEPQYLLWFFLYCIYITVEISNEYDLIRGSNVKPIRTKIASNLTHNILESPNTINLHLSTSLSLYLYLMTELHCMEITL